MRNSFLWKSTQLTCIKRKISVSISLEERQFPFGESKKAAGLLEPPIKPIPLLTERFPQSVEKVNWPLIGFSRITITIKITVTTSSVCDDFISDSYVLYLWSLAQHSAKPISKLCSAAKILTIYSQIKATWISLFPLKWWHLLAFRRLHFR